MHDCIYSRHVKQWRLENDQWWSDVRIKEGMNNQSTEELQGSANTLYDTIVMDTSWDKFA